MRQSMAFNLEFKITYDELSPSLQDMFKSLQGQITDNRNEITNINMDITDITNEINEINKEITTINNHLTQIDNSITNINKNIQNIENNIDQIEQNITKIEGDITNLGDQITEINNNITIINDKLEEVDPDTISNLDFLNLAPKIGFYQDDTIEVISKYNMNYQYRQYVIYHDNKGQEVLYFGGNDGSYKQTNTYYPFKGIRTDQNSPFVFKNSPLNIPLIDGGKYALAFLSCGNYFMIVAVADKDITSQTQSLDDFKLYLYDTHYSSDESIWEGKNIYPLIYSTVNEQIYGSANAQIVSSFIIGSNIRFYYNYDKKLLFAFYIKVNHALNKPNEHPFTILVFNMNNNSFIRKIEMPNPGKYIGCSNSFSFNTTKRVTEVDSSETNINNNLTEGWEPWRIVWFPKQELLKVSVRDKTVNYCNWPYNGYTRYNNYSMVFTYRVPIALWNSGANVTITDYNTRQYGPGLPNDMYGATTVYQNIYLGYRNNYAISRDEMNSISIFSSIYSQENFKVLYEKNNIARVDDTTVKDDDRGWLYYGNKFSTIPAKFLLTTDASIWGKGWTYGLSINNMVQLSCYSNQNSVCTPNNIMVSKFQFVQDTTDEYDHPIKVVRAAEYTLMNKDNVYSYENPSGGGSLPVFSYEACIRFSNTIENSPRYCHTGISSGTDGVHLSSHYIQLSSDKKYYNNPIAGPSIIFKPPRYQGNGTTNYYLNEEYGTKQEFRGAFYNPFGDFYFYGLRDLGAAGTKTRNKFYFIVIEGNGKAHYFGQDFESSWNSNFINSMNGIANSQYEIVNNCVSCLCFNSRTIQFLLRFTNNSLNNTYGIRINVKLTFNQDFSNFTMETPRNPPGIGPDNNFSTTYGGDTIGFISCNRNWLQSPLMIYTQKPLPGVGGGTSYTIDQYLYEAKFNKYKIYTESNQGLLGYVPSTNIFLGGYYTVIQNPIQFNCIANNDNYVYLERGEDRDTINAIVSTTLYQEEGERMFSRICIAKITCNSETITAVEYYRINIGYNDYIWNGGGVIIDNIVASGTEGQILKIHNTNITPDNNFRVLRVVDNDTDFNNESKTVITMKSIFDTWDRHNVFNRNNIFNGEIGLNDGGNWKEGYDVNPTAANWTFIEPNYINNSNNQSPFSMFISPLTYTNHEITLFCHRLDSDDDMLIWVLAWKASPTSSDPNRFDTLSVIKMDSYQNAYNNGAQSYGEGMHSRRFVYRLVLNLGSDRQFTIVNQDRLINTTICANTSKGKDYKLWVKRSGRNIQWKVSALGPNDPNQCPLLDSTLISYNIPTSKPSDWSDDNWNCLQDLINYPQKVGVGTLSQPCRFTIVETSLFSEIADIYRLDKGKIYSYDNSSSSYVDSGKYISDNIPHHSWLYNSSTKKLFNYQGTSYTYIDH